jgi:hypothetical protein
MVVLMMNVLKASTGSIKATWNFQLAGENIERVGSKDAIDIDIGLSRRMPLRGLGREVAGKQLALNPNQNSQNNKH